MRKAVAALITAHANASERRATAATASELPSDDDEDDESRAVAADDLLPLIILALLRARVPRLTSQIAFVERFRSRAHLTGEEGYLLCQLAAGAAFLEAADATHFSGLEEGEFARWMGDENGNAGEHAHTSQESESEDLHRSTVPRPASE